MLDLFMGLILFYQIIIETYILSISALSSPSSGDPCLGRIVKADLVTPEGVVIRGENRIYSRVPVCPRKLTGQSGGKGYWMCRSICRQPFHAETDALHKAKMLNIDTRDAIMYVKGHYRCCDNCIDAMKKANLGGFYVNGEFKFFKENVEKA